MFSVMCMGKWPEERACDVCQVDQKAIWVKLLRY